MTIIELKPAGATYRRRNRAAHHVYPVIAQLKAERLAQGKAIVDLALELGYSPTSLARWERGEFIPSVQALHDWAEGLGVELRVWQP